MANTEHLGFNYRGTAWSDGEQVKRVALPDGSLSEGMAALGYMWDAGNNVFVKMIGDATNGLKVQLTTSATITTLESTGLVPKAYDYISYASASTTDTYVYKTGGSGGTTVATVTVTWTDSTKTVLSTVARA